MMSSIFYVNFFYENYTIQSGTHDFLLTFHSNQRDLAVLIQYRRVTDSATQPNTLL